MSSMGPPQVPNVCLTCRAWAREAARRSRRSTGGITLTWVAGSSVKLEQVIGDKDWAAAKGVTLPTASLTAKRYDIYANGFGTSFEDDGKVTLRRAPRSRR